MEYLLLLSPLTSLNYIETYERPDLYCHIERIEMIYCKNCVHLRTNLLCAPGKMEIHPIFGETESQFNPLLKNFDNNCKDFIQKKSFINKIISKFKKS